MIVYCDRHDLWYYDYEGCLLCIQEEEEAVQRFPW
jgi:hypothetical protein